MKRITTATLAAAAVLLTLTASAFGWGFAVHAHVADQIGKRAGDPNVNEVYGATLPDLFNYAFALPPGLFDPTCGSDTFFAITHTLSYADVLDRKNTGLTKRLAAGFYSHNEVSGADLTAHVESAAAGTPGYVIARARALQGFLDSSLADTSIPPPLSYVLPDISQEESLQLYHSVVEYAVDLLMDGQHPHLGPLMMAGASFWPTGYFPPILTDAFADDLAPCFQNNPTTASSYISFVEMAHRQGIYEEGYILTLPHEEARYNTASRLAVLAILYLGYSVDPGDPDFMDPGPLTDLADAYLQVAMGLCQDYDLEVEATVDLVWHNMADAGIIREQD